jgi:hypothetical protein
MRTVQGGGRLFVDSWVWFYLQAWIFQIIWRHMREMFCISIVHARVLPGQLHVNSGHNVHPVQQTTPQRRVLDSGLQLCLPSQLLF